MLFVGTLKIGASFRPNQNSQVSDDKIGKQKEYNMNELLQTIERYCALE